MHKHISMKGLSPTVSLLAFSLIWLCLALPARGVDAPCTGNWYATGATPYQPVSNGAAAYDTVRDRAVVFGGYRGPSGVVSGETWEFNRSDDTWTLVSSTGPSPRTHAAMCFDPVRNVCVLHGGNSPTGAALSDTWTWNGTVWTQVASFLPSPSITLRNPAVAFDFTSQTTILIGAKIANSHTLSWDGTAWTVRNTSSGPSAGSGETLRLLWEPTLARIVCYAGVTRQILSWNGTQWNPLNAANPPPARRDFAMGLSTATGPTRLRVLGGESTSTSETLGDIWDYDPVTNAWIQYVSLSTTFSFTPGTRRGAMVWDENLNLFVFGGRRGAYPYQPVSGPPATFEYLGDLWLSNGSYPFRQIYDGYVFNNPINLVNSSASAYDASRQRLVTFGGLDGNQNFSSQIREFDGSAWIARAPLGLSPGGRIGAAMAYVNPTLGCLIFGGSSNQGTVFDTWSLDGSGWRLVLGEGPRVSSPKMVFDSVRNRVVLVGVLDGFLFRTFELDPSAASPVWTLVSTTGPSLRGDFALAYDPQLQRTVLYGGNLGSTHFGDTWAWNGTTWSLLAAAPVPNLWSRSAAAMTWDSRNQVLLLFGGYAPTPNSAQEQFSDVWALEGSTWRQVTQNAIYPGPQPRARGVFEYFPPTNRSVVFGGLYTTFGLTVPSRNWQLDLLLPPRPLFGGQIVPPTNLEVCDTVPSFVVRPEGVAGVYNQTRWFRDGVEQPQFANASSIVLTPSLTGTWRATLTNACGSINADTIVQSLSGTVTIASQPQSRVVVSGASATFTVGVSVPSSPAYRWRFNGVAIAPSNPTYSGVTTNTLTVLAASASSVGSYDCVIEPQPTADICIPVTSSAATLAIGTLPTITQQPPSINNGCLGGAISFSTAATGTGPLQYRWQKGVGDLLSDGPVSGGAIISGANTSTLTISGLSASDIGGGTGVYSCVISNPVGSVTTSDVQLAVRAPTVILSQSSTATACAGFQLFMSITDNAFGPTYVWRKNSVIIPGADQGFLSIPFSQVSDSGTYTCTVTGLCGSVTSLPIVATVNPPPIITSQPPSSVSVCVNQPLTLSVQATGAGTLAYEWFRDSTPLPAQTGPTLNIPAAQPSDAGTYQCFVSNACGRRPSTISTVVVPTGPIISAQPVAATVCENSGFSFSLTATGTGSLSYQWRRNGTPLPGATAATYIGASGATAADAGSYDCVVTDTCASTVSAAAVLIVNSRPSFSQNLPSTQSLCSGATLVLTANATSGVTSYQWRRNNADIPGATSATYVKSNLLPADAGTYFVRATNPCGSTNSTVCNVSVSNAIAFSQQPADQTPCELATLTLQVAVTGGVGPPAYQWRRNSVNIPGAVNRTLSKQALVGDDGSYDCIVTTDCGSITSLPATVTVRPRTVITSQLPNGLTACVNQPLLLTISATGSGVLTYQWTKAGVNVAGQTSATLSIPSFQAADAGQYRCVVTSDCGSATSGNCNIITGNQTVITGNPTGGTICAGAEFTLTAGASFSSPITWLWRKDGVAIPGAPNAQVFTRSNLQPSDSGIYDCVVTGGCGSATTNPATLTVSAAPTASISPSADASVCPGTSYTMNASVVSVPSVTYQWRRNGSNILGATAASYTINNMSAATAGLYTVVVTSACGSGTSPAVTVSLGATPVISIEPLDSRPCYFQTATYTVSATGVAPITYQWRRGGVPLVNGPNPGGGGTIAGASTATLTITGVRVADASAAANGFDCVVTSPCGTVTSARAALLLCASDFNCSGPPPTVQDIFAFLNAWFAGSPSANFDSLNGVDVSDIFSFLNSWFVGCS